MKRDIMPLAGQIEARKALTKQDKFDVKYLMNEWVGYKKNKVET